MKCVFHIGVCVFQAESVMHVHLEFQQPHIQIHIRLIFSNSIGMEWDMAWGVRTLLLGHIILTHNNIG